MHVPHIQTVIGDMFAMFLHLKRIPGRIWCVRLYSKRREKASKKAGERVKARDRLARVCVHAQIV